MVSDINCYLVLEIMVSFLESSEMTHPYLWRESFVVQRKMTAKAVVHALNDLNLVVGPTLPDTHPFP